MTTGCDRFCPGCGARQQPGAKFCTECGTALSASPVRQERSGGGLPYLGWAVAGLALIVLAGVLLWPDGESAPVPGAIGEPVLQGPVAQGDPRAVDISRMSPRERADRLFDRVMRELSAGDTAQALAFVPMALDAHAQVEEMDPDMWYHQAVLLLLAGDAEGARAQADSILAVEPAHLFGLHAAGRAHQVMGDAAEAEVHYRRLLEHYDSEVARSRPEYQAHGPALPHMRRDAERFLGEHE